jgi:hypothetical protein
MPYKNSSLLRNPGVIVATVIAVVAVAAVVIGLSAGTFTNSTSPLPSPAATSASPEPTDEAPQPEATPSGPSVQLTFAGLTDSGDAVEAGGYVEGIVEADGTCILELSKGDENASVVSPATPDATTTQCGTFSIATSLLAPGEWTVVLRYQGGDTDLASEPVVVEVAG